MELPVLAEFSKRDGARVRIVIVGEEARARDNLRQASAQLAADAVASRQSTPRAILREAGDSDGILPYARSLSPAGKICAKWRGRLTLAKAQELVSECAHLITSRP